MRNDALKRFFLAALLWLPLMFFLWFWFASPLAWPVIQLAKLVLLGMWPQVFSAVAQGADLLDAHGRVLGHPGYLMQLSTNVMVNVAPAGQAPRLGLIEPTVNPMIYGYALPLLAGLLMATPLPPRRRLLQGTVGIAVIWVAQTFGVVAESLKTVVIDAGSAGLEAAQRTGLSPDAVALCYQFGYLILPSLVPAVLWIVMNQRFIATLTRRTAEPVRRSGVEAPPAGSPQ